MLKHSGKFLRSKCHRYDSSAKLSNVVAHPKIKTNVAIWTTVDTLQVNLDKY
jgi:hypothetical protein